MSGAAAPYQWAATVLLASPWLIPPQMEPSPALLPWLVSIGCAAALLVARPPRRVWLELGAAERLGLPLARAWLMAALISTFIAFCQYAGIEQLFPGMSPAEPGQVYGNLRQRNQYATLTVLGLLAAVWWSRRVIASDRARNPPWLLVAVAFLAGGNAMSGSRTGLLELALVTLFCLGWGAAWKGRRTILLTAGLAYTLVAAAVAWRAEHGGGAGGIIARAAEQVEPCATRSVMWQNMLELIRARPWAGWGWGELDYAHFMTRYQGLRQCELIDNAHNLPLHLAVELGLPFTVLCCALALYGVWRARPWQERDPTRRIAWTALAVILVHSMVEYPLWYGPFMLAALVCLSILLRWAPTSRVHREHDRLAGWQRGIGLALLAGVALVAWDYHRIRQIYLPPGERSERYREQTLDKLRSTWFFRDQFRFAEYTITPLTRENAAALHAMGLELLHYSPEPRVVAKLIESATLLERNEEARFYLERFRAAYPKDYARWSGQAGAAAAAPD